MDSTTLLKQAHKAIQDGQKGQARQLLQESIRQNPQDYRAWLWLASVSTSPQASLEYVRRAEMLKPHSPIVKKARAWAENRAEASPVETEETAVLPPTTATTSHQWSQTIMPAGLFLFLFIALIVGGLLAWTWWVNPSYPPVSAAALAEQQGEVRAAAAANTTTTEPILPSATPTSTPISVPAKSLVAASDDPRPTWTLTPTPTNTPIPTDTPPPTYVSASGGNDLRGRPLGVAADERWIDVNLSSQILVAYEGNEPIFETYISSGTYEHPTVTGQFRIWLKYEAQTMDGSLLGYDYYLENVPYVMYFYNDYALHGTFWHNNFGTPMSHGCVNMETSDAQWVFSWAGIGTVVNVHY